MKGNKVTKKGDQDAFLKLMKKGYQEMAEINRELAECALNSDNEANTMIEHKLTERE